MLQWQVKVMAYSRFPSHCIDQPVGNMLGVSVHQTQPGQLRHSPQNSPQQIWERVLLATVMAVGCGILSDNDQLCGPVFHQIPGLI